MTDPCDMGDVELVAEYQRWLGMRLHPKQVTQHIEQRIMSVGEEFERRMWESGEEREQRYQEAWIRMKRRPYRANKD